jgi:hypothetical protein
MAKKKLRYITVLVAEETYQAVKAEAKKSKRTLARTVREILLAAINIGAKK